MGTHSAVNDGVGSSSLPLGNTPSHEKQVTTEIFLSRTSGQDRSRVNIWVTDCNSPTLAGDATKATRAVHPNLRGHHHVQKAPESDETDAAEQLEDRIPLLDRLQRVAGFTKYPGGPAMHHGNIAGQFGTSPKCLASTGRDRRATRPGRRRRLIDGPGVGLVLRRGGRSRDPICPSQVLTAEKLVENAFRHHSVCTTHAVAAVLSQGAPCRIRVDRPLLALSSRRGQPRHRPQATACRPRFPPQGSEQPRD